MERLTKREISGITYNNSPGFMCSCYCDNCSKGTEDCDRYGNKIWENDILKTWSDEYAHVKFGLYITGFASDDCNQGFYVEFPEDSIYRHELGYWCKKTYVIGNIFDNKELLQEEHK